MAGYSGAQCAGGSSWVPSWSVASRYCVASKPFFSKVKASPLFAKSGRSAPACARAKVEGPKPAQTGIAGVIVWVRSTYFARFKAVS